MDVIVILYGVFQVELNDGRRDMQGQENPKPDPINPETGGPSQPPLDTTVLKKTLSRAAEIAFEKECAQKKLTCNESNSEKILDFIIQNQMYDTLKEAILNILITRIRSGPVTDLRVLHAYLLSKGVPSAALYLDPFAVFLQDEDRQHATQEKHYPMYGRWESTLLQNWLLDLYQGDNIVELLQPTSSMVLALAEISDSRFHNALWTKMVETDQGSLAASVCVDIDKAYAKLQDILSADDSVLTTEDSQSLRNNWDRFMAQAALAAVKANDEASFKTIIAKIHPKSLGEDQQLLQQILQSNSTFNKSPPTDLEPFIKALFEQKQKLPNGGEKGIVIFDFTLKSHAQALKTYAQNQVAGESPDKVIALCIANMKPLPKWRGWLVNHVEEQLKDWAGIPALHPLLKTVLESCPKNTMSQETIMRLLSAVSADPKGGFFPLALDILRRHDNVGAVAHYLKQSSDEQPVLPKGLVRFPIESASIEQLEAIFARTDDPLRAPYMKSHKQVLDWLDVIVAHASKKPGNQASAYASLIQSILGDCYKPGVFSRKFLMKEKYEKIEAHIDRLLADHEEGSPGKAVLQQARDALQQKKEQLSLRDEMPIRPHKDKGIIAGGAMRFFEIESPAHQGRGQPGHL